MHQGDKVCGYRAVMTKYIYLIEYYCRKDIDGAGTVPMPSLSSAFGCPICNEEFQAKGKMQPMSLTCGHSFCVGKATQCDFFTQSHLDNNII